MAASERYYRLALRASVASLCQSVGWHGIHNGSCDVLTDVLARYLQTLGKTTVEYCNHAERSEPNLSDVYFAFNELNIVPQELSEYFQNVDVVSPPTVPPTLPVPRPQTHLYNGSDSKVLRKRVHGLVTSELVTLEEENGGSAGEGEGEGDDEWEEIPGYLPPLPKIQKDKTDDKEDTESGIHMTEEDDTAVATPTSLKSPPIIGNAGLPSFSYHRAFSEGDDESASRRSSISEEFTGGGMSQTLKKLSVPSSPLPKTPATPTTIESHHSLESDSLPPVIESPSKSHDNEKQSPLVPSSTSIEQEENVELEPIGSKPKPSPKPKPNLTIPIEPLHQEQTPSTVGDVPSSHSESPRMPQLHLMSPVTPLSPIHSMPQLSSLHSTVFSSLHKTPPSSPLTTKPVRPVLRPLPTMSASFRPLPQSSTLSLAPTKESHFKTSQPNSPVDISVSEKQLELDPPVTTPIHEPTVSKPTSPLSPKVDQQVSPESTPESSQSSELSPLIEEPSQPLPSPTLPLQQVEGDLFLSSSSSSSASSPASVKPTTEVHEEEEEEEEEEEDTMSPIPSTSQLSLPPPPPEQSTVVPYLESFTYHESNKQRSPLSTQEEEDDSSDSDTSSESIEYPLISATTRVEEKPSTQDVLSDRTTLIQETSAAVLPVVREDDEEVEEDDDEEMEEDEEVEVDEESEELGSTTQQLTKDLSPASDISEGVPKSLTVRIHKGILPSTKDKETTAIDILSVKAVTVGFTPRPVKSTKDLTVSSSHYQRVESILPPEAVVPSLTSVTKSIVQPVAPLLTKEVVRSSVPLLTKGTVRPVQSTKDLTVSSSQYQKVDSIHSLHMEPPTTIPSPSSLVVKILRKHLIKKDKSPSVSSEEGVKVTIPKSVLPTVLVAKRDQDVKRVRGHNRGRGRGRKRGLDIPHTGLEPKKIKTQVSSSSSSSTSDDDEDKTTPVSHPRLLEIHSETKTKSYSHSLRSHSDDSEDRDQHEETQPVSGGLKLRLKLPQLGDSVPSKKTGRGRSKQTIPHPHVPPPNLRVRNPSPKIGDVFSSSHQTHTKRAKSDSLFVQSSGPKKVPSIKLKKVASPSQSSSVIVHSVHENTSVGDTGPEVYICPTCRRPDDGTPMICCDNCDIWLHMRCVGLTSAPPDDKKWFCPSCTSKKNRKSKKR